jgi:DNA-binding LytR/AlgR family response regulator
MKIAICDDDKRMQWCLEDMLEKSLGSFGMTCSVDLYARGDIFCSEVCKDAYDLIFLDIKMPGENGMEVGDYIRNVLGDMEVSIVFMSSSKRYALSLFQYHPLNFLIKPITIDCVKNVLNTYLMMRGINIHCFCCKVKKKKLRLALSEILYFSSDLRKVTAHLVEEEITFYDHLDQIYSELKNEKFLYVHKSYLVNYDKIAMRSAKQIVLVNGESIPISQSRRKAVKEKLKRFDEEKKQKL